MRAKQHGQVSPAGVLVMGIGLLLALTAALVVAFGRISSPQKTHHGHQIVRGEFLSPINEDGGWRGRYAYQSDDGTWWLYYWQINATNGSDYYRGVSTLPSGGFWARSESSPAPKEVLAEEQEQIAESASEEPETETPSEVENQVTEPENNSEISEPEAPAPSESAPAESSGSSSSSDSGSSDSGSSDGGGDGGGSSD